MVYGFKDLSEHEIRERLVKAQKSSKAEILPDSSYPAGMLSGTPRPAAVLIPFLRDKDAWHILFIRRSESTALREAREEIGLDPADAHVLGRLDPLVTITNYRITPIVGKIPWPYRLNLEHNEVSKAFIIPLEWLADPANHENQTRKLPPPFGSIPVIYFRPFQGEILWGASARITLNLLEVLFN
jgi:8-oxo-dGTP pyrophosphatase MutT (NUDIX family)